MFALLFRRAGTFWSSLLRSTWQSWFRTTRPSTPLSSATRRSDQTSTSWAAAASSTFTRQECIRTWESFRNSQKSILPLVMPPKAYLPGRQMATKALLNRLNRTNIVMWILFLNLNYDDFISCANINKKNQKINITYTCP